MKPPLKMNPNTTGVLYSVTAELEKIVQILKALCAERPEDRHEVGIMVHSSMGIQDAQIVKEALGRGHEVGIMVHSSMGIMDAHSFRIKH